MFLFLMFYFDFIFHFFCIVGLTTILSVDFFDRTCRLEYHAPWFIQLKIQLNKLPILFILHQGKRRANQYIFQH